MAKRLAVLACLLVLLCARSTADLPRALPNDAYIWQFAWTPSLANSIASNGAPIRAWRVLVDETPAAQPTHFADPDWKILAVSGKPVVLVHRIDGRAENLDAARILSMQASAAAAAQEAGVTVAGMEIDFDCATARLSDYTLFLQALRQGLPVGTALSITALPTWLNSPNLKALLAIPDETILQVHAIDDPAKGLFDPSRALDWIEVWSARSPHPFRVALPAYGARVDWAANGKIIAVTGEAPRLATGDRSAELIADPAVLASFAIDLARHPPANLAGLVWFRLPSSEDTRSWSEATWRDVLAEKANFAPVISAFEPGGTPGLLTITLINPGRDDMRLPRRITLDSSCTAGDGANEYDAIRVGKNLVLQRRDDGLLPGLSTRIIGWTRCLVPEPANYLEP